MRKKGEIYKGLDLGAYVPFQQRKEGVGIEG